MLSFLTKPLSMKQTLKTLCLTAALSLAASFANAATTAYTDPVGALSVTLRGGSDTYVAVPFAKAADFQGTLSGAPTGAGLTRTLSITGTPSFGVNSFQNLWYVQFTSGVLAGRYYTVASNTATQITINIDGDTTVSSAGSTDSFKVVKYWTLGSLFPEGQTAIKTTDSEFNAAPTEVQIPSFSGNGINLSSGRILVAVDPTPALGDYYWSDLSDFSIADDFILPPDGYFVVRHYSAPSTTFVSSGSVSFSSQTTGVFARNGGQQDNFIGLARPKDVNLSALFTAGSPFVESSDEFAGDGDLLFLYDNSIVGFNKSVSKIFAKSAADHSWYDQSDFSNADTFSVPASSAIIIRKLATATPGGQTTFFTNDKNY